MSLPSSQPCLMARSQVGDITSTLGLVHYIAEAEIRSAVNTYTVSVWFKLKIIAWCLYNVFNKSC